ncbi:MAG TPA: cell wall-active antibiotics response protein LiaF [Anaerolineae bacterium]
MMRNQGQIFVGAVLILLGVLFLVSNIFNVDIGAFCWPLAFILLGVWLLLRPQMLGPDTVTTQKLFGEIERTGAWQVVDEEIWAFITDLELDMTKADIPPGETYIRCLGFVGDVELFVPEDVGVKVSSTAFVSDVSLPDQKQESFLSPVRLQTNNYKMAERKIYLETTYFVGEVKVRQL